MIKNKIINSGLIDLAQPRLGSKIIYKTDDFFAPVSRIINPSIPIWKEGIYDNNGKWMDGWETRRKRTDGHDCLILSFGKAGKISKINIDTSYFNGNQPNFASVEACYCENFSINNKIKWETIINKSKIKANNNNIFNIKQKKIYTHLKLNIYPDGGVARLRVYGKIATEKLNIEENKLVELSSIMNGSLIIATNNEHFGKAENILAPGRAFNMSDGWETRRRRTKGYDWLIFKFGIPGIVKRIIIDTLHFKGNFPDQCSLQASYINDLKFNSINKIIHQSTKWKYLINKNKLFANREHSFENNILINKKINFIRLNIYPDGGISRINIFGTKN